VKIIVTEYATQHSSFQCSLLLRSYVHTFEHSHGCAKCSLITDHIVRPYAACIFLQFRHGLYGYNFARYHIGQICYS
jgi:hypothetical protein